MIARTNDFKEGLLQLGREIDFKIDLYENDKIITENEKFLLTEDNANLIVEQLNEAEIDETITSEDIFNVSISRKCKLLSTIMKEFDFEITQDLRIGDLVDCSFGLKINDNYEYINYGKYIIYSKEKNENRNTYSYVAFDSMLLSMVKVNDTSIIQNVTVKKAIENICDKVGLIANITQNDINNLPNLNKVINEDTFKDIDMTYRDVLDMICQCLGVSIKTDNKTLSLKVINRTSVDEFDESFLKDTNVTFGQKYGPINSVLLSRSEDQDIIGKKDEESIALNGLCEFKIQDNLIMLQNDREDYLDEIFEQLNGLEYSINDFSSTGITYLEPLDFFDINIANKTYKCLLLNDEIKIKSGIKENIYTKQPKEAVNMYTNVGKTDKEVSFIVDKQHGEISSKVSKDNVISSINQSAEQISINANKIKLEGYTSINEGFSVDLQGNMNATSGHIAGFTIDDEKGLYSGSGGGQAGIGIINKAHAFWAGGTDPGTAPFHVGHDGKLSASDIEITNGGIRVNGDNFSADENPFIEIYTTKPNYWGDTGTAGVFMHEYGLTAHNEMNDNYEVPTIRTETDDGFAELCGTQVNAYGFNNVSLAERKQDFEKLNKGLDIINNIDIYKFRYKNQKDNKKHIGFVIGKDFKYSQQITNNNNDGVDLYSFVSVCCKAIQEQQEQIEELKQEIKSLKGDDK